MGAHREHGELYESSKFVYKEFIFLHNSSSDDDANIESQTFNKMHNLIE